MKVYVVMGNDYPDAVFSTPEGAEQYCVQKQKLGKSDATRIHWRSYEFDLDKPAA